MEDPNVHCCFMISYISRQIVIALITSQIPVDDGGGGGHVIPDAGAVLEHELIRETMFFFQSHGPLGFNLLWWGSRVPGCYSESGRVGQLRGWMRRAG